MEQQEEKKEEEQVQVVAEETPKPFEEEAKPETNENKAVTEESTSTDKEEKKEDATESLSESVKELKVSDETPEPPKLSVGGGFFGFSRREPLPNVKECWEKEAAMSVKERRQRYRCRKYIQVGDIPSWTEYSKSLQIDNKKYPPKTASNPEINSKIALYHVTEVEVDAIVNAANSSCLGGGGIDGAIHRAAGDRLYQECRTLNGCQTGHAKITRGYNLPAKFVIHAVGPIGEDKEALTSCYESCLKLVLEHNIKTIVFCGISSGIYGYPVPKAAQIALSTVREWLENEDNRSKVDKIVFCTFLKNEKMAYDILTPVFYPK